MKTLKQIAVSGFVLGSLLAICPAANANVSYTTSSGAVFTQVNVEGFGLAWRDPAGQTWSDYQGEFTNTALLPDWFGIIRHSEATQVCQAIGGRLPSAHDYKKLMTHFATETKRVDGRDIVKLTAEAANDFETLFPDSVNSNTDQNRTFWTTTVGARNDAAHFVINPDGRVGTVDDDRNIALSVRCIRDAFTK